METDALERKVKEILDNVHEKITTGFNESVKSLLVGLASTTPFDTGYHANNWQISENDDDSTIGTYSKKNRRTMQEVINNTEQRFKEITGEEESSLFIFNNAKMIEDLEEGNPTAGTGEEHANPGFVEAQKNIFIQEIKDLMGQTGF